MSLKHNEDSSHFISLSDIMTALMLVFMFLSVAIIFKINQNSEKADMMSNIVQTYEQKDNSIYKSLTETFDENKRKQLGIKINEADLSVSFEDDTIKFDTGKSEISKEFAEKLDGFFPYFINNMKDQIDDIQEIRIEGYADTDGIKGEKDEIKNYLFNMRLSQNRARNVLEYCINMPQTRKIKKADFDKIKEKITANGLSSSKMKGNNKAASRRVEFRIITTTNTEIAKSAKSLGKKIKHD